MLIRSLLRRRGEECDRCARCPKCHVEMEEGFVKDESYGTVHPSKWVEGEPETSFWTGTKTRGKRQVQVRTFRCARCGYLESYAT